MYRCSKHTRKYIFPNGTIEYENVIGVDTNYAGQEYLNIDKFTDVTINSGWMARELKTKE